MKILVPSPTFSPAIYAQSRRAMLVMTVILPTLVQLGFSESPSSTAMPRSNVRISSVESDKEQTLISYPPWVASPMIDDNGFLRKLYRRIPGEWEKEGPRPLFQRRRMSQQSSQAIQDIPVVIRQAPGDGNCLFHSISLCCIHAHDQSHIDIQHNQTFLWSFSSTLRELAVDCLEKSPRKLLFLQGNEYLRAHDLVESAAAQYGITGEAYCEYMRQQSYWGGGPEIVALCNVLQRPIHVYELHAKRRNRRSKTFVLRRMACFGSPKYDRKSALHILSADSRFPDVLPGKQLESGNHFLAIFPTNESHNAKLRGGSNENGEAVYSNGIQPPFLLKLEEDVAESRTGMQWFKDFLATKRT